MRLRPVELTSLCITSTLSGPSPPCDTLYLRQNHIRPVRRTNGKHCIIELTSFPSTLSATPSQSRTSLEVSMYKPRRRCTRPYHTIVREGSSIAGTRSFVFHGSSDRAMPVHDGPEDVECESFDARQCTRA